MCHLFRNLFINVLWREFPGFHHFSTSSPYFYLEYLCVLNWRSLVLSPKWASLFMWGPVLKILVGSVLWFVDISCVGEKEKWTCQWGEWFFCMSLDSHTWRVFIKYYLDFLYWKKLLSRGLHSVPTKSIKKLAAHRWEQAWSDNNWTNPGGEDGIKLKEMNEQMLVFCHLP